MQRKLRPWAHSLGIVLILLVVLWNSLVPTTVASGAGLNQASTPDPTHTIFLPHLPNLAPTAIAFMGFEVGGTIHEELVKKASAINAAWLRNFAFDWSEIEPLRTDPPTYRWEAINEDGLQAVGENGMKVIATVKYAPSWAQKTPGIKCGAIAEAELERFAQFMGNMVRHYSRPPYNILYWELGNEPDISPAQALNPDNIFGCWGDETAPLYGGEYYAEMLKRVYPAIKAANPQAQVLIGGLLLDCDPTHPETGKACASGNFFEGILANGGGDYFDIVSFHGYAPYFHDIDADREFPGWKERGGVVMGKISFLREVMQRYDIDKPLLHTEAGLLCPEWNNEQCSHPGPDFYEAQADYAVRLYLRNQAAGILGTIWYTLEGPGWRHGGLVNSAHERPAYQALEVLSEKLALAEYVGPVEMYPELEGYEFVGRSGRQWVLWPKDGASRTISLPENTLTVFDKYAQPVVSLGNQVAVSGVIYIQLAP